MKKKASHIPKAELQARPVAAMQRSHHIAEHAVDPQPDSQPVRPGRHQAAPQQLLRLQRSIGNHAVTALVSSRRQSQPPDGGTAAPTAEPVQASPSAGSGTIQRKINTFDLNITEKVPARTILDSLTQYNKSVELATLEGGAWHNQWQTDNILLGNLLGTIADLYFEKDLEMYNTWAPIVMNELELLDKAKNIQLDKERRIGKPTGPIAFTSKPTLAKPEPYSQVMPGVEYLEATINNKVYHLYAGQDYLNAGYSAQLLTAPPTKTGNIDIYVADEVEGEDFRRATVGDAHHRFLWGAHHSITQTAKLIPRGIPAKIYPWSDLTYKHNPKYVFPFNVKHPIVTKLFNAALSPLPIYQGKFEENPLEFVSGMIKDLLGIPEVIFENGDDKKLIGYLLDLVSKARSAPFAKAITSLAEQSDNKEHAMSMANILLHSFSAGEAPNVALGPTPSVGYYSPDYHVVVLDPTKNGTPDALLDTLAFETGNALRRDAFLNDKKATTSTEFNTMEAYIDLLLESTHSGTINGLVVKLGIPDKYFTLADAKTILSMDTPKLDMPSPDALPDQKSRSALAWFKMQDWTDEQRKQYFSTSAHAEGMEATSSGYKDTGSSQVKPIVQAQSGGESQPSFTKLVLEIITRYPNADQYAFNGLQSRHYGEFLRTGRIEKWTQKESKEKSQAPEEVFSSFIQDLKSVYPNWDNMGIESLTYTDYGDFMMTGMIKSWEKMSEKVMTY